MSEHYVFARNNPVLYSDPTGHGITSLTSLSFMQDEKPKPPPKGHETKGPSSQFTVKELEVKENKARELAKKAGMLGWAYLTTEDRKPLEPLGTDKLKEIFPGTFDNSFVGLTDEQLTAALQKLMESVPLPPGYEWSIEPGRPLSRTEARVVSVLMGIADYGVPFGWVATWILNETVVKGAADHAWEEFETKVVQMGVNPLHVKAMFDILITGKAILKKVFKKKPGPQEHHFATNKGAYATRMKEIPSQYGLDLDDVWNKEMIPHAGRHPYEYHEFVLLGLERATREAGKDKAKFLELFEKYVKTPVRNNPGMLRKAFWE